MTSPLDPPVRRSELPPFHRLDWQDFERLTIDLLREQDGITGSRKHGLPGRVGDFGVDVIAERADGSVELASCKCYEKATPTTIAKWLDEFLKHWDARWVDWTIRRFILVTSVTNLSAIKITDRLREERKKFAARGLRFDLWGPGELRQHLSAHRQIAATYLQDAWADVICGPMIQAETRVAPQAQFLNEAVVAQLHDLQKQLSGDIAQRTQRATDLLRAGDRNGAAALSAELRSDGRWSQFDAATQATVLRLEGSLKLQDGDFAAAERYEAQAAVLAPNDEPRLAARIVLEREGPQAALARLGQPTSLAGRQLEVALLLGMEDRDAARPLLDALRASAPTDPETLRLDALALLADNDRHGALARIDQAEAHAGNWTAILRAAAVIRYSLALSPSVPLPFLMAPNPVIADLVREDDRSQRYLDEAWERLERLQAKGGVTFEDDLWRLAILSSRQGRRDEAAAWAEKILLEAPGDPTTIAWIIQRDLPVDLTASRAALMGIYQGGADLPQARVLGLLLAYMGDETAETFLAAHLERQDEAVKTEAGEWIARFQDAPIDENSRLLRATQVQGDWSEAALRLAALLAPTPPDPFGIMLAQYAASAGRWDILAGHVDALLCFQTAPALRLAVLAADATAQPQRVVDLLSAHSATFGGTLPDDMRRARARALATLGGARDALLEAAALAAKTGALRDQLFLESMRAHFGNVRDAPPILRKALAAGLLEASDALSWAQRMREAHPDLARALLHHAIAKGVQPEFQIGAMFEARQLGLMEEAQALFPQIERLAAEGHAHVRLVDRAEAQAIMAAERADEELAQTNYLEGSLPIHLTSSSHPGRLLAIHYANDIVPNETGSLRGRLLRNGARPREINYDRPYSHWHIHLDVTGLIESHRLGLLDHIECHPNGIRISKHLPKLLQQMKVDLAAGSSRQQETLATILRMATAGIVKQVFRPALVRQQVDGAIHATSAVIARSAFALRLVDEAILSSEEADLLAPEGAPVGEAPAFDPASPYLLSIPLLERLVELSLLERVAARTELRVSSEQLASCEALAQSWSAHIALARIADAIAERIGVGLELGTYRFMDRAVHEETQIYGEEEHSTLEAQLVDLLDAAPVDGGVAWIDDRNLTGYVNAASLTIVGTPGMLHAMATDGAITVEARDDMLRCLRASGTIAIPFVAEEIIPALLAAPVIGQTLVETPALAIIRRAYATTTDFEPHVKMGPAEGLLADRPDENQTIQSTMRILSECLAALWTGEATAFDTLFARSDWLWQNLATFRTNRVLPENTAVEARREFVAMQIAHCLDKGTEIAGWNNARPLVLQNYQVWCWERFVVPRLSFEPELIEQISLYLANFYAGLLEQQKRKPRRPEWAEVDEDRLVEELLLKRAMLLPPPIAQAVKRLGPFENSLKVQLHITIAQSRFDPARFWAAMILAVRSGRARLRTTAGGRVQVTFKKDRLLLKGPGALRTKLDEEIPRILAAPADRREAAVLGFCHRYDFKADETTTAVAAAAGPAAQLASYLHDVQAASAAGRYSALDQSLAKHRGAELEALAPAALERQAHFLRLDLEAQDVSSALRNAFDGLARDVGLVEAVKRLGSLAHPALQGRLALLTEAQVASLGQDALTPFAIVTLAQACRRQEKDMTELDRHVGLLAEAIEYAGEAFIAMLEWTQALYARDYRWAGLAPGIRWVLTWTHADRVLQGFLRAGIAPARLKEGLADFPFEGGIFELLARPSARPIDQADVSRMTSQILLYHGIGAILDGASAQACLSLATRKHVEGLLLRTYDGVEMPDASLVLRRPEALDSSGGVLSAVPADLLDPDPLVVRENLIDLALDRLATNPGEPENWAEFSLFTSQGLSADQYARYAEITAHVDVYALASGADRKENFFLWRAALGPHAWMLEGQIEPSLAALAEECAFRMPGPVVKKSRAERALGELLQIAALAGAWKLDRFDDSLTTALMQTIADHWPESVPTLRLMAHDFTSRASAASESDLRTLDIELRRRP
ncbi:MAG: hypothetical protein C0494_05840 [Sphingobium sp.]|nr:hypothetical protein [Sphingobium sp.]